MSEKTTDPTGHLEVSESPDRNLSKLTELARQAYEQKRTKDCLDLTRAMLLIDPDNANAHWMRASIQSDIQQDLEHSRLFLQQVQTREIPEIQSQPGSSASPSGFQVEPRDEGFEPPASESAPAALVDSEQSSGTRWLTRAGILVVLVVALVAGLSSIVNRPNFVQALLPAVNSSDGSKPVVSSNATPPASLTPFVEVTPAPTLPPARAADPPVATDFPPASVALDSRSLPKTPDPPVIAQPDGTLAVSSPASVDIYKDETYLGSAPVSLELPAGTHTLEYRHGNMRRSVTHAINSNETTRAMITFDVAVQINSRPWAEVFLDGVERKALGQTPLSSVRVPIGGVLIFENPQFPPKKYRVTGNERIQIVFP